MSACGEDTVSADDYVNDLCTALSGWADALRERQAELAEGAEPDASPEAEREALAEFVDAAAAASDDLVDDIEDAGVPDVDDGGEVADAFHAAAEDTRDELEDAQDAVAELPTDSTREYRAAVDEFVTGLRSTLEGISEPSEQVAASPELEKAFDETSACSSD